MSSLGGVRAPPVARKGMRMCCVDAATVLALVVLCASLAALLLGMLARFPAGDFAPVRIKYRWNDESCTTEMSFMCRDKRGEFIFHEAKLDWFGAREACTAQDMTLASLHSEVRNVAPQSKSASACNDLTMLSRATLTGRGREA